MVAKGRVRWREPSAVLVGESCVHTGHDSANVVIGLLKGNDKNDEKAPVGHRQR